MPPPIPFWTPEQQQDAARTNTTAHEESIEHLIEARKVIHDLRGYLGRMDAQLDDFLLDRKFGAFPIAWCEDALRRSVELLNQVALANGAILVRGKPKIK